jgi:quinol monooxygenase YgiN
MAFVVTRISGGDYDTWKALFDQDVPRTRASALNHRVLRNVADPNEVYIVIEYASTADAQTSSDRLVASGVLDRFTDCSGPMVTEVAEFVEGPG